MTAYEMRISDWSSDVCSSDLLDQDHELVAAEATDRVDPPQRALEAPRDGHQQLVADAVAEGVVDRLEVVEVEEHGGHRGAVALGSTEQLLSSVADQGPVRQAGELVVERLVGELGGALGHELQRPVAGAAERIGRDNV